MAKSDWLQFLNAVVFTGDLGGFSRSFRKRLIVSTGGAIVSGFSRILFGSQRRFKPIKHILAARVGVRGGGVRLAKKTTNQAQ